MRDPREKRDSRPPKDQRMSSGNDGRSWSANREEWGSHNPPRTGDSYSSYNKDDRSTSHSENPQPMGDPRLQRVNAQSTPTQPSSSSPARH